MAPMLDCDHTRLCRRHMTIRVNDVGSASVNCNPCDTGSMHKAAPRLYRAYERKIFVGEHSGQSGQPEKGDSTSRSLLSTEIHFLVAAMVIHVIPAF